MAPRSSRLQDDRQAEAEPIPEPRQERAAPLLQRLQSGVGNRAAAGLIQRDPDRSGEAPKDASATLASFDAANPGITAALSYDQLKVWHDVIEGWAGNRKVDEALERHEKRERASMLDPTSTRPIISSDYLDEHARIADRRKFVDERASQFALAHSAILAPEIEILPAWNVGAEQRFRSWAVKRFAEFPLLAELSTRREVVSQLERTQNPGLQEGAPHVNLLWGGGRIRHTKGIVTWDDLMHITEFSERYEAEVSNGPEIQALRTGIHKVDSHIQTMKIQHQTLSDANAEHGVVRHVSEALGSPSPLEIAILRQTVKQNVPHMKKEDALALENLLAEKEAETGNYPKLKDNEQGEGIWHNPDLQLAAAKRFYEAGQIELALGALSECEESTTLATSRFAGYERRVMGGAGIAVKWLERAKTAGKVASAFTGTGGVVRAAFGAAGYTFAQEGSEQVVAHWIDPSNKIDLGGLAEQAAIEGLASLFGGVTQGAFVEALTARFSARLVARGWSETMTKTAISAWGATTASFYNVPAKIVLDRVIAGKAMPSSLAEVSKMVVDEAITAAPMDLAGSFVHASSAKPEPTTATDPAAPHSGPEIAPPREVVDSLAGPAGRAGAEPAAPMAAGERGPAPKTIIAEARMIAGHLEPLRHEWANLSPAMRAERLVAGVHETLAASGLPKPIAILKKDAGGLFHKDTWIVEIEGSLLKRDNLSVEEFAWACEIARHEMEHAMQFFRIARREHARTGESAKTLADRLHMPIERVQEAIDSNAGTRKAEPMPAGGAVDASTAAVYDNIYDPVKKERRREVLGKLDGAISALKQATDTYGPRITAETDPVLLRQLSDEWQAIEREHRPTVEEYRNFPEEVPAFKAGGEVAAAVKEQARLADTLRAARLAERKAYAGATGAWDAARGALADTSKRVPTTTRASINRATKEWINSLDATRKAEHDLITALESGK